MQLPPDHQLDYPFPDLPAPGGTLEVAPGLHWVRMPLPFALDHINLWLLEDGAHHTVVDTGIALPQVQELWQQVIDGRCAGRPLNRLIVTHCHPDHLGLASWFEEQFGLPLWISQGEYLAALALIHQHPGFSVESMCAQFRRNGLDEGRLSALGQRGNAYRRGVPSVPARFDRLLDGQSLGIGGHTWKVMAGYGHSPEHSALYCAEQGVLISGDMVLPRISTNVSVFAVSPDGDPLGLFLDSLDRLRVLPTDTLVLPAHGRPFRGLHARIDALFAHHAERCDELLAACAAPRSAAELLSTLFPRELDTHQVMFAMGEAIAHLNHLEHAGRLTREAGADGVIRFVQPN